MGEILILILIGEIVILILFGEILIKELRIINNYVNEYCQ